MAKMKYSTIVRRYENAIYEQDEKKIEKYHELLEEYAYNDDFRGWEELIDWDELRKYLTDPDNWTSIDSMPKGEEIEDHIQEAAWYVLGVYLNASALEASKWSDVDFRGGEIGTQFIK